MRIALDFDGTYTEDPVMWDRFISLARSMDHEVHVVTMRAKDEGADVVRHLGGKVDHIWFTDRKAKREFMELRGLSVQVWIDDMPDFIIGSAAPRDLEQNAKDGLWLPPGAQIEGAA